MAPRDRRALRWGAIASLCVVVVAAVIPVARRWSDRESLITARRGELGRLRGIASSDAAFRAALDARDARASTFPQRPVAALTPELAAGVLQSTLQRYADESMLQVSELGVVGDRDAAATSQSSAAIPATLVAVGDIVSVTDLLRRVQDGPTLLEIRELTVQVNPARRSEGGGELLQLTMVLRAPFVIE